MKSNKISKYFFFKKQFESVTKSKLKKNFTISLYKINKNSKKKNYLIKNKFDKKAAIKLKKNFKNYSYLYLRKLFNSFIKAGKKSVSMNYFFKIMFFVCMQQIFKKKKIKKLKKSVLLHLYFNQILNNIMPIVIYTNLMFRGKNILLPWLNKNKKKNKIKLVKVCVSWTKKSIYKRKEKTLFFKILSELEDSRKNKSETVLQKKNYYLEFYKNKYYIRFLKKRTWV